MSAWVVIASAAVPVSLATFFAQLPDASTFTVINGAIAGSVIGWFMWLVGKDREERSEERKRQDARDALFLAKQERIAESVDNLTRSTLLAIVNSPDVMKLAKENAEKLLDKIGRQ